MLTLYHWSLTAVRDLIRAGGYLTGYPRLDNGIDHLWEGQMIAQMKKEIANLYIQEKAG